MQILLKLLGASIVIISLSVSITININFYNQIAKLNSQTEDLRVDLASNLLINEHLKANIENLSYQITNLSLQVSLLNSSNLELNQEILNLNNQLINKDTEFNELSDEFVGLKNKTGLINPTYKQLKDFVWTDKTDENEYSSKFDCSEFTNEFIGNFEKEGYFSCMVEIDYPIKNKMYGHHLVAVNTSDKGLIYLEPQDDKLINPVFMQKGYNYCSAADWECKWEIKKISSCFSLIT